MEEKTWYGVFDGRSAVCWLYDNPEDARTFGNGGPKHPIGGGVVYPVEINDEAITNKKAMLLLIIAHAKRTSFEASTIKIMQETGVEDWSQIPFGELVARANKCGFADMSIGPSPKMIEYLNQNRVYGYTYGNMICYWNPRVIRNRGDRAIRKPRALKEDRLDRIVAESTRRVINEFKNKLVW